MWRRGVLRILGDGMIEWEQKSTLPPPPKKETLETPKNFFCFINNIRMTTSDCFEYAENPHVNETLTKNILESKISKPQKSFNHPRHLKSGVRPPPPTAFYSPKFSDQAKLVALYAICERSVSFLRGCPNCPPGISASVPAQNGVAFKP